jgi:hypothetical protein
VAGQGGAGLGAAWHGQAGPGGAWRGFYQPSIGEGDIMIDFVITLTGTRPLLMHNERLADPLDPGAKAVKRLSAKRNKTDQEFEDLAKLEHEVGMYYDPDLGPYVPGRNLMKCLTEGGTFTKQGKDVSRGVFIKTDCNPLVGYKGPRDPDGLYKAGFKHRASVVIGGRRIMRCRAWFPEWVVQAEGSLDPTVLEFEDLEPIATKAGMYKGLCDWRPGSPHGGTFGTFSAKVERV